MSEYESLLARVRALPPDVRLTFVREVLQSLIDVVQANSSNGPVGKGSTSLVDDEVEMLRHVGLMEKYG